MSIEGRMARQRERCIGMTEEERAWRAKWIKDQVLAPDEPQIPKEYYKQRFNPIRRFYRAPMDAVEAALTPKVGSFWAGSIRHITAKCAMGIFGIYAGFYYFKYNRGDWTSNSGWRVTISRPATFPGDPDWPNYRVKEPHEYATFGFEKSPI